MLQPVLKEIFVEVLTLVFPVTVMITSKPVSSSLDKITLFYKEYKPVIATGIRQMELLPSQKYKEKSNGSRLKRSQPSKNDRLEQASEKAKIAIRLIVNCVD